ncbi:hypothetical protein [Sphingobacterium spiritivorum]
MSVFAQQTPPSRPRSGSSFTQIDDYLSVIKRLGIPTADSDVLDGLTSGPNAAKIVYNTTLNKLRVYNPVTAQWRDAIEADLSNYYTKVQADSLTSNYVKVNGETTGSSIFLRDFFQGEPQNVIVTPEKINLQSRTWATNNQYFMDNESVGYRRIWNLNGQYQLKMTAIGVNPYGIDGLIMVDSTRLNIQPSTTRRMTLTLPKTGSTNINFKVPISNGVFSIPISVNGVAADQFGNITLPSIASDLQSTVNVGNTSDREIVITGRGGVNPAINGLHLLVDGVGRMDRPTIFGVVNNQRSSWIGLGEVLTFNVLKELGDVKSLTLDPMKGLVYGSDMSTVYTDRSLVDKAYVDNRVQLVTLRGTISGGVAVLDGGPVQPGYRYLVQGACLYSLSGVSPEMNYTPEFISLNKLSIQSGVSGNIVAQYETISADNGKEVEVLILKIKQ